MKRYTQSILVAVTPVALFSCALAFASGEEIDHQTTGIYLGDYFARDNQLSLVNNSNSPVALDGWRILTSDAVFINFQSDPGGLDGITIQAFSSLAIQLDNDASIDGGINANEVGSFADYESSAFAVTLFQPNGQGLVAFDDPMLAVDHMQWSVNGEHHPIADTQNLLAVEAGLWKAHDDWIDARQQMYLIEQTSNLFSQLNGSDDYRILILFCSADMNGDGNLDFFDVSEFLEAFSQHEMAADFNHDSEFDFFDVSTFLDAFANHSGCF